MFLLAKAILSGLVILIITAIAKKASVLGGLVAMMPFNIVLSLIWLNYEGNNAEHLGSFAKSALFGVIPTILFLLLLIYFLQNEVKLFNALFVCIVFLGCIAYLQYAFLKTF